MLSRTELGIAEDRVERRAQLVAHIGEELRLVLARDLELVALDLDFVEQAGVLDRQHRLRREGLQQVDRALGKLAGRFSAHDEGADDAVGAEQRNEDPRQVPGIQHDLLQRLGLRQHRRIAQVGILDRLAQRGRPREPVGQLVMVLLERRRSAPRSCRSWREPRIRRRPRRRRRWCRRRSTTAGRPWRRSCRAPSAGRGSSSPPG